MERGYWKDIAVSAQLEAAEWWLLAQEWRDFPIWRRYAQKAADCYARARWAMSSSECP